MVGIISRLRTRAGLAIMGQKASTVGPLISWSQVGRPAWSKRDYAKRAAEGYQQNPISFACIHLIATAFGSVPLELVNVGKGGQRNEIEAHPLLDLLDQPNPDEDGSFFRSAWASQYLISGNAYTERVEGIGGNGLPSQLFRWRSDRVTVIPGPDGWPQAYEYSAGGQRKRLPVQIERNVRPILHVKAFHPLDDWYGMSAVDPASYAIDVYADTQRWNKGMLQNSGQPSGALVYSGVSGQTTNVMTPDQRERIKAALDERVVGAKNAGRPIILEGGLDWKAFGFSPKDMDFVLGKADAARDIARSFGVPPMMLGIPGDNTYSNYREANRAFYRQTVIPLLDRFCRSMTGWLIRPTGDKTLRIVFDQDEIDALSMDREAKWQRAQNADFLTVNEKRVSVGYDELGSEGDIVLVPANMIPLDAAGEVEDPNGSGSQKPIGAVDKTDESDGE